MKIAIYDKSGGGFSARARAAAEGVFQGCELNKAIEADKLADELRQFTIVVCHVTRDQWKGLLDGAASETRALVRTSSVGASGMESYGPPRKDENGRWILHLKKRSEQITDDEWRDVFVSLQQGVIGKERVSPEASLVFGATVDHLYALRLLCEAWLVTEGGGVQKPHGIAVHAPTTATDWFGPFDESPNVGAVSRLGKRMGVANEKHSYVEKVLGEVVAGTLAWKTSQAIVEGLRDDLDVTTR